MINKYREFVEYVVEVLDDPFLDHIEVETYLQNKAKELLNEDFEKQVIDLWSWELNNSYNAEYNREKYKNMTRTQLVCENRHDEKRSELLEKNWNRIDEIIDIIRKYIKEKEQNVDED